MLQHVRQLALLLAKERIPSAAHLMHNMNELEKGFTPLPHCILAVLVTH